MGKLRSFFITLLQAMFEYLLLFPVILIAGVLIINFLPLWIWILTLIGALFVGISYRTLFPEQKWWAYIGFSITFGVLAGIVFGQSELLLWILLMIVYPVLIYRGMMYANQPQVSKLPVQFLWAGGFMLYFISYFLFRFIDTLKPFLTVITVSGVVLVITTLFITNSKRLKTSTLSKKINPHVSQTIKRQNRILLIITIMVIGLLSMGQYIQKTLLAIIRWLFGLLPRSGEEEEIIEETIIPTEGAPEFPFGETKEPSVILKFLEQISIYAVYFFLSIVVVVLLLMFIKKTRMWLKKAFTQFILFLKRLGSRGAEQEVTAPYVDEKENVFSWKDWKKEQQDKAKGLFGNIFKREPSFESLPNRAKVRYVYRHFLLQQKELSNYIISDTPRETLEKLKDTSLINEEQLETLREAYEQSRYGETDIDEELLNEIQTLLK